MTTMDWLPLWDGTGLGKWYIDGPGTVELDGDVLVLTTDGKKAEVGGESWDNYVLSADVMFGTWGEDELCNLQLTGQGTCYYCILEPGLLRLQYIDPEKGGRAELGQAEVAFEAGTWIEFQMKAENNVVTGIINGDEVLSHECPRGTKGFAGFLANPGKNGEIRIRNIRIRFLSATDEQLREYKTDALTNWLRLKENEKKAQPGNSADS
ncbi:MAG TPA: family 16 glycoside hydrolase [bacterium]|nr:family 16 glycoside hydrolase [bacterium]